MAYDDTQSSENDVNSTNEMKMDYVNDNDPQLQILSQIEPTNNNNNNNNVLHSRTGNNQPNNNNNNTTSNNNNNNTNPFMDENHQHRNYN